MGFFVSVLFQSFLLYLIKRKVRSLCAAGFVRNYGYKYDSLNRLKDATYQKPGFSNPVPKSYDENLTYDKNGNIMSLKRNGDADDQLNLFPIDDLSYTYLANSNKLMQVTDAQPTATSGFKDGSTTGDDYVYDANGNMTVDKNKNITSIVYNHLNLPTKIIFTTGNIVYIYTASGQKMQKTVTEGTNTTTTDYLGGYQYQNTVLQFFPTAEGYVKNTPVSGTNTYSYVFNYADHLGNVRISYTQNPSTNTLTILDENSYYPFGLKHTVSNAVVQGQDYKYKYNGKELQDEMGLNMYDYGSRLYDPARAGWSNVDQLAEKYPSIYPYAYVANNPVNLIDPDGREIVDPKGRSAMSYDKKGNVHFTKYATNDIKRIVNALNLTSEGRTQLRKAHNSDIKVKMNISSRDFAEKTEDGKITRTYGETIQGNNNADDNYGRKINSDGTYGIKEATITIYEGSINENIKDGSGSRIENLTTEQAIGSTAGHEIIHATDKAEINKDIKYEQTHNGQARPKSQREDKTYKVENKIIEQSKQLNN